MSSESGLAADAELDFSHEAMYSPQLVAPPSDPWLARRMLGFGASEIGALYLAMGLRAPSPDDPRYLAEGAARLIGVKAGLRKPAGGSRATAGGQRRERDVLRVWADGGCPGSSVVPWSVRHADEIPREYLPLVDRHCPRLVCTPDGYARDDDGQLVHVEVKTTWRRRDERHTGPHLWWGYELQVQAGIAATGAHSGVCVVGLGYASDDDGDLAVHAVARDEEAIAAIRAACIDGWSRVERLREGAR